MKYLFLGAAAFFALMAFGHDPRDIPPIVVPRRFVAYCAAAIVCVFAFLALSN